MLDRSEIRARLRRKLEQWPDDRDSPVTINEGLELLDIVEHLEQEANWLAKRLSECSSDGDYCLPFCPYHIDKQLSYCDYNEDDAEEAACDGELPCTHSREECWREAARNAVEEASNRKCDLFDMLAAHPETRLVPEK